MLYVCLAEAALIALLASIFAGALRSSSRAHARREDLLVNQLLNAVGRTWQPPPRDEAVLSVIDEAEVEGWRQWTASPEQEPVY